MVGDSRSGIPLVTTIRWRPENQRKPFKNWHFNPLAIGLIRPRSKTLVRLAVGLGRAKRLQIGDS